MLLQYNCKLCKNRNATSRYWWSPKSTNNYEHIFRASKIKAGLQPSNILLNLEPKMFEGTNTIYRRMYNTEYTFRVNWSGSTWYRCNKKIKYRTLSKPDWSLRNWAIAFGSLATRLCSNRNLIPLEGLRLNCPSKQHKTQSSGNQQTRCTALDTCMITSNEVEDYALQILRKDDLLIITSWQTGAIVLISSQQTASQSLIKQ